MKNVIPPEIAVPKLLTTTFVANAKAHFPTNPQRLVPQLKIKLVAEPVAGIYKVGRFCFEVVLPFVYCVADNDLLVKANVPHSNSAFYPFFGEVGTFQEDLLLINSLDKVTHVPRVVEGGEQSSLYKFLTFKLIPRFYGDLEVSKRTLGHVGNLIKKELDVRQVKPQTIRKSDNLLL